MVAPGDILDRIADHDAREPVRQVLVAQLPGALDIDDGDTLSGAAGTLPGPVRVHSFGRGPQIALAAGVVGGRGRALLEPLGLFRQGGRRRRALWCRPCGHGAGLDVRRLDLGEGRKPGGQLQGPVGPVAPAPYTIEEREVRHGAPSGRPGGRRGQGGPRPLLVAEQRLQGELFVAEEHVEGGEVRPGGRPYAIRAGAQPGLGPCDDDQLRLGSLIGESSSVGSRARRSGALTWECLIGHRGDRSLRVRAPCLCRVRAPWLCSVLPVATLLPTPRYVHPLREIRLNSSWLGSPCISA